MKTRASILVSTLSFTLVLSTSAWTQNFSRAREAAEQARNAASASSASSPANNFAAGSNGGAAMLESAVPRAGMQFYMEVRKAGLAQLMQSASALDPLVKMLAGQAKISSQDFSSFAFGQMGALANSRLALVSYGGSDVAALIEAASATDGEAIKSGLAKMLASTRAGEMEVRLQDRLVVAGAKPTLAKLAASGDQFALGEDRTFLRMRERFSDDPFFAFMEYPSMAQMMPGAGDPTTAAMAGMLSNLANQPYAIAMGGSLEGDMIRVRALALFASGGQGLFSGIFSPDASNGKGLMGASFASPDSDIFIALSINWEKLYDSIESMFSSLAGSMAGAEMPATNLPPAKDMISMLESQLGFSIKHNLLPTLGSELAISFADFGKMMKPAPQPVDYESPRPRPALPRIFLMVELRDQATFEQLFTRLLNPPTRQPMQLAQETYRGVTIKSGPAVAFAITKGYFLFAPSPVEIRRALDARALGNSLAASADFRAAVGSSEQAALQAYFSPAMTGGLFKSVFTEMAKANEAMKGFAMASSRMRSAVGITMKNDSEGMMMEMRVPTSLAFMAMASLATTKPAPYGITTSSGQRRANGRRTPKMTDEDVKVIRKR